MGKLTNLNPSKALTESEMPPGMATDIETTNAMNAHLAAVDSHLQYATQARADERYGLIKKIVIRGNNTPTSQGASILIAHGLSTDRICAVGASVEHSPGLLVPPGHTISAGYEYEISWNSTHIFVSNKQSNSSNILNKPIRLVIDYSVA
jgi:hypothetical protein